MIKVVAIDGTDHGGRPGEKPVGRVLAEFEVEHPLDPGDEVTLPCGSRMVVTKLHECIREHEWAQCVAVVPAWVAEDQQG